MSWKRTNGTESEIRALQMGWGQHGWESLIQIWLQKICSQVDNLGTARSLWLNNAGEVLQQSEKMKMLYKFNAPAHFTVRFREHFSNRHLKTNQNIIPATGRIISRDFPPLLFKKFRTRSQSLSGLNLCIYSDLVNLHTVHRKILDPLQQIQSHW